ncbi:EthD family reductase [Microdochium nivale]|nr:EthD family reductase [Microdochium nivale]
MTVSVSVVYPKGSKFNMDYYLATHMPLVQSRWASFGLKGWKVIKYDDNSPYSVQAILEWDTEENLNKTLSSEEAKDVFGDIVNFTDSKPELLRGQVQAFATL